MMKLLRLIQILLTLFYGQYISNAIYDNTIRGISDLVDEQSFYNITKVCVGILVFFTSIFGLIVIWRKRFGLIYISGMLLIIIFLIKSIANTVVLVKHYESKQIIQKKNWLIAEITIESMFQILGISLTFFISSNRQYDMISHGNF